MEAEALPLSAGDSSLFVLEHRRLTFPEALSLKTRMETLYFLSVLKISNDGAGLTQQPSPLSSTGSLRPKPRLATSKPQRTCL